MGLLQRIEQARAADLARAERRYSADAWYTDYLAPAMNQWGYQGAYGGLTTTWVNGKVQEYSATLPGHSAAVRNCPPAFAAQMVRALVISQMRFTFRNLPSANVPRKMFGTQALKVLEEPWPTATSAELLTRMEWHAGLAGNAYVTNYWPGRLRVLRPDWVAIVFGSDREPDDAAYALDGKLLGYAYINGGMAALGRNEMTMLLPEEVAHWAPLPDPEGADIGMSWISAAMRDIQGDRAATDHKVLFFENGATPNLVVKGITAATKEQFDRIVEMMDARHTGVANAYRTLYLTAGADATVVGSDLKQLDFKATQGAGETRIAMLGRVPAPLLGISEGLSGSSLNAGNFGMARRIFADTWIYPTMQDIAGSLARLVKVPSGAELWFDTTDMPILREDAKDAAEIEQIKQTTINGYVREGWEPESAKAAVRAQDISLLKHSGLVSVQLQPPGTTADTMSAGGAGPKVPAGRGRPGELRRFDPTQPRNPENGKWIDTSPGDGLKLYTLKRLFEVYGESVDEVGVVDLEDGSSQFAVMRFGNGDMAFLLNNAGPDGAYAVLKDGGPDDMRDLADRLEWAATGDVDAAPPSENGLVDWTVEDDGILVGYDPTGDVRIGFPSDDDPDELVEFDLSGEDAAEAWELIDALRDMADANDTEVETPPTVRSAARPPMSKRRRMRRTKKSMYPPRTRSSPARHRAVDERKYDPAQPRVPSGEGGGQWTASGVIRDVLKLLGKIDLDRDETLLGSGKLDVDAGGARFALIRRADGGPEWRIGFGGEGFGQAFPDDDIPAWDGNPGRGEFNQTAALDDVGVDALRAQVTAAFERAEMAGSTEGVYGRGVISGTRWGDIHWQVYMDDPAADPSGPELSIGVLPKGDPGWADGRDWQGYFDESEWRKLIRQIEAARAALNNRFDD